MNRKTDRAALLGRYLGVPCPRKALRPLTTEFLTVEHNSQGWQERVPKLAEKHDLTGKGRVKCSRSLLAITEVAFGDHAISRSAIIELSGQLSP